MFQNLVKKNVENVLNKHMIAFKKNEEFLTFNIYKIGNDFYLKASFTSYNYRFELTESS